jgi:hypothetical protein
MPIIDLDFGNLTPKDGEYNVVCTKVDVLTKKNSTDKYMKFWFEITEPEEFAGTGVEDIRSLLPQSRKFLQAYLQGLTGKDYDQDGMTIDTEELVGCQARAVIVQEKYEGVDMARIKRLYQASDGSPFPQFEREQFQSFFDSGK